LKTLKGHTAQVTKLSFSSDSKILASASADGTIRLWQITNGQEIKNIEGNEYPFWNLSFSRDSRKIVSVSDNGIVEIWKAETLDFDQLILRGCNWLDDYLKNNSNVQEIDKNICN
jgi:WD40 repeat protein